MKNKQAEQIVRNAATLVLMSGIGLSIWWFLLPVFLPITEAENWPGPPGKRPAFQ